MNVIAPKLPQVIVPSTPPVDQAARLRAMAGGTHPDPELERHCPVVAVTSGKGGVGKTTVSVNLAIALARRSLRVVLVDADPGLANADLLCGLSPSTRLDAAVRNRRLGDLAVEAPGGFRLIPGAAGLAAMANLTAPQRDSLLRGVADVTRDADIVLVDTGAGLSESVMAFVAGADLALVVTTPEPPALTDGYAMLKCLRQRPSDNRPNQTAVFMNHAMTGEEGQAAFARLAATCGKFLSATPWLAGVGIVDKSVSVAVRERRPVLLGSPKSLFANELCVAAERIAANMHISGRSEKAAAPRAGFWRALLGISPGSR